MPKNHLEGVKVGDTIHVRFEQSGRKKGPFSEWTVIKVGRAWLTAERITGAFRFEERFSLASGWRDDGPYSGDHRAYLDKEAVLASDAADAAWDSLRINLRDQWQRPTHLTADQLKAMLAAIKGA